MSLYYDSSALVPLYVLEETSADISRFLKDRAEAVFVNELHEVEIRNALRLKRYRGEIEAAQLAASLNLLNDDLAEGSRLIRRGLDWQAACSEAERLSGRTTEKHGVRTLDLIHIAVALVQGVSGFVTHDERQRAAASAAGLNVVDLAA